MSNSDLLSGSIRDSGTILLIIGCIFSVVGLPFLIIGGVSLYDHYRSASWTPVQAYVEKLEWHEEEGDDSTTYRVSGEYRYQWASDTYRSTRITGETGSSSDRESWRGIFDTLSAAKASGAPVTVLVDPASPKDAIAVRKMTVGLLLFPLLGAVFFSIGAGFTLAGIWGLLQKRAPADSERPWVGAGPWEGFQVRGGGWGDVLLTWFIACFIVMFVGFFVAVVIFDSSAPFFAKGIVGFFALFAVLMVYQAIYMTLRKLKYGDSLLLLSQIPLVPGREFDAVVMTKRALAAEDGCRATLKCIAIVKKVAHKSSGNGSKTKTTFTEETRYEKTVIVRTDLSKARGDRSAIPVRFEIPGHLPPRFLEEYPQIRWKLALEAETPGIDFFAEFELPVYAVPDEALIQYRTADA